MLTLQQLEQACQALVKTTPSADKAHEYSHIKRVVVSAKQLAIAEQADFEVVLAAAYLHDIVSLPKNHPQRAEASQLAADKAVTFLQQIGFNETKLDAVHHAICAHSYSANITPLTIEAKIVQDADRMDAIGAIGIARCIQVGTALNRALYAEEDPFCENRSPDDLTYTLDHFYQKLFKLAETMNCASAKAQAHQRIQYMRGFMQQLQQEIHF